MSRIEREAVRTTAMLLAAEKHAPIYAKAPVQHAQMIQNQARMHVTLVKFYKAMAAKAGDFINWQHYNNQVKLDYNVDVIINDDQIDSWDDLFIKVTYKPVNNIITAGAASGRAIYKKPISYRSTDEIIQQLTTKHVAALVGKKVLPNGSIIDNPNAAYNVTETVRNDIATSIKTSLDLGETTEEATARMQEIIGDPMRAERIANTEAVNAYNAGVTQYGEDSGAVGMEWEDAGATDECAEYSAEGVIPFDGDWDGLDGPPAHPNCLCAKRLVYADEMGDEAGGNTRPDYQSPADE